MPNKRNKDSLIRREATQRKKAVLRNGLHRNARPSETRSPHLPQAFSVETDARKLSEVILNFAEPLLDAATSISGREKAVSFSIACWNASLLPLNQHREMIELMLDKLAGGDEEIRRNLLGIFAMMHHRKQTRFAHDRRFILDFKLTQTRDGFHLQVASTLLVPPKASSQDG